MNKREIFTNTELYVKYKKRYENEPYKIYELLEKLQTEKKRGTPNSSIINDLISQIKYELKKFIRGEINDKPDIVDSLSGEDGFDIGERFQRIWTVNYLFNELQLNVDNLDVTLFEGLLEIDKNTLQVDIMMKKTEH